MVYINDLLNELKEYGKRDRARIVYRHCLKNKKFALAAKIKAKYNLEDEHDDTIIAIGYAIKNIKKLFFRRNKDG